MLQYSMLKKCHDTQRSRNVTILHAQEMLRYSMLKNDMPCLRNGTIFYAQEVSDTPSQEMLRYSMLRQYFDTS